jgi:hypothetical protein
VFLHNTLDFLASDLWVSELPYASQIFHNVSNGDFDFQANAPFAFWGNLYAALP